MSKNRKLTNGNQQNKAEMPYKGISVQNMLAVLATLNPMAYFKPPTIKAQRECLNCDTKHRHSNAFCSVYCCHAWRGENPQRGRGNHYYGEFNLAYKTTPDGFFVQVSL